MAGQDDEALTKLGQRPGAAAGSIGALPKDLSKLRPAASGQGLSRAEATIRQMTHDWAAACNNKQIEDLLDFYSADAMVMRPNVPPVRGTAAIREFFVGALQAGLGDVEMDPLRVDVLGDVAYQAGRCKMLVPVVMGKRREERGKYVIVFAKDKGGAWKAVVDSWSSDLGLNVAETLAPSAGPSVPPKPRR
jgi:ketosteroid isomerase-like protein